ncbi:MAG: 4-hydroxy-3-methylbut-2-enyl diphosphate reductase, partial [Synergistaceae bacterium]|nr:4-hydroxy-3-methylbut-2-enyl diphosphate reductase [Synergistaceae bacterium]
NHPEIKGIIGHVSDKENSEVIADENEAHNVQFHAKTALISQTTQREERLERIAGILTGKSSELRVCNTICKATAQRQEAVRELVRKNHLDGVVLIGGKSSANTGKLRDILKSEGVNVLWVEDESETEKNSDWFNGKIMVGIAAGASTPEWLIHKIKNIIAAKQDLQGVLIR